MLRSLFSGISGLRAHQQMMDVTGNNIANVNTTGYKSSQTVFQDTLSQMVNAAGAPQNGRAWLGAIASLGLGWANMLVAGVAGRPRPHPDLLALGLDRTPTTWDDLRRAYRAAARTAHPDAPGGSGEAFLAVAGAFERLSNRLGARAV